MSENKETFAEKLTRLAGEHPAEMAHKHLVSVYLGLRGDTDLEPQVFIDLMGYHRTLIDAIDPVADRYHDLVYMSKQLDWWYASLPDRMEWEQANPVIDAAFAVVDKFTALDDAQHLRMSNFVLGRIDRYRPQHITNKKREDQINTSLAERFSNIMTIAEKSNTVLGAHIAQETYEQACQFFEKDDTQRLNLQTRYVNHCVTVNDSKPLIYAVNMLVGPLQEPVTESDDSSNKEHFVYAAPSLDKLATALLGPAHHKNPLALQACGDALDLLLMNHIQAYYVNPRRNTLLDKYKKQKDQLELICNQYSMLPPAELEQIEYDIYGPEALYIKRLQENGANIQGNHDNEDDYSPPDWPKPLLN